MVSCLVQTIKKQPNYLGWREQTSATLSLQASTNRSEVLPQNEFTYAHLGPITDYIVLTVHEKQIKKCWNDPTYSLIIQFSRKGIQLLTIISSVVQV